jgi:hypothetical protein
MLPRQGFGYAALVNGDGINAGTDPGRCFQVAAVETLGKRLGPASLLPNPEIQPERFPEGTPYDPRLFPTTRDNFIVVVGGTNFRLTGIRDASGAVKHLRARITVLSRVEG